MDVENELAARIRVALGTNRPVREKRMFGALCFMVGEKMALSAFSNGALLVRVDPDRSDELLAVQGAEQAEMGRGRSMGPSWISVSAEAVADDASLAFWMGVALEYNKALVVKD